MFKTRRETGAICHPSAGHSASGPGGRQRSPQNVLDSRPEAGQQQRQQGHQGARQGRGHGGSQPQRSCLHPKSLAAGRHWGTDAPGSGHWRHPLSSPVSPKGGGPWEATHILLGGLGVFQVMTNNYPWNSANIAAFTDFGNPAPPAAANVPLRTSPREQSGQRFLGPLALPAACTATLLNPALASCPVASPVSGFDGTDHPQQLVETPLRCVSWTEQSPCSSLTSLAPGSQLSLLGFL